VSGLLRGVSHSRRAGSLRSGQMWRAPEIVLPVGSLPPNPRCPSMQPHALRQRIRQVLEPQQLVARVAAGRQARRRRRRRRTVCVRKASRRLGALSDGCSQRCCCCGSTANCWTRVHPTAPTLAARILYTRFCKRLLRDFMLNDITKTDRRQSSGRRDARGRREWRQRRGLEPGRRAATPSRRQSVNGAVHALGFLGRRRRVSSDRLRRWALGREPRLGCRPRLRFWRHGGTLDGRPLDGRPQLDRRLSGRFSLCSRPLFRGFPLGGGSLLRGFPLG